MKSNKDLKDEYKLLKPKIGVFQVRNTVNGKIFIDSSVNLDKIWNRHRVELNFGGHRNEKLQKEWKEFGEENFQFEILSEIEQEDNATVDYAKEAKQLAAMFIEELQPFGDKGYNRK
ncbi:MAG: GIY-YIG nuclease family protein [Ferruginibacter sp.]